MHPASQHSGGQCEYDLGREGFGASSHTIVLTLTPYRQEEPANLRSDEFRRRGLHQLEIFPCEMQVPSMVHLCLKILLPDGD